MPKSNLMRTILFWVLAVVITLASAVYQRLTGPTYPVSGSVNIEGQSIDYELIRTHESTHDALIKIAVPTDKTSGKYKWRRFKSYDAWTETDMIMKNDTLVASIPKQPAAGKVTYTISLFDKNGREYLLSDEPVIMRFKDPVPDTVLIIHIFLMFGAMLISTRTGLEALLKGNSSHKMALLTLIFMFFGGLIFGPVIQKYAFNAYWTGWPLGNDLTDSKTAVAFIFWLVAVWRARVTGKGYGWYLLAAIVTFVIFLIPHSLLGSELDYTKME